MDFPENSDTYFLGKDIANIKKYGTIINGATLVREVGQGRNPAALSDIECVLFFIYLFI